MLGKKKDFVTEKIDSIVGSDVVIEGTFTAKNATKIDGTIKGKVISKGSVFLGKSGVIEGSVEASNIMIAGTIKGDIRIGDRIEATETAKITGDIFAKSLSIDENASFEGRCTMNPRKKSEFGKESSEVKADENEKKEEAEASK